MKCVLCLFCFVFRWKGCSLIGSVLGVFCSSVFCSYGVCMLLVSSNLICILSIVKFSLFMLLMVMVWWVLILVVFLVFSLLVIDSDVSVCWCFYSIGCVVNYVLSVIMNEMLVMVSGSVCLVIRCISCSSCVC